MVATALGTINLAHLWQNTNDMKGQSWHLQEHLSINDMFYQKKEITWNLWGEMWSVYC